MTKAYREITQSVSASLAKLRVDTPGIMKGFSALAEAATRDGALTRNLHGWRAVAHVRGRCTGGVRRAIGREYGGLRYRRGAEGLTKMV